MTKAARIMELAAKGLTVRQIACEVYQISVEAPATMLEKHMAYVRVVVRQRKGKGASAHDKAYRASEKGREGHRRRMQRYFADPAKRARKSVLNWQRIKNKRATDPEFRANDNAYHRVWRRDKYHSDPTYREKQLARARAYYQRRKVRLAVAESESASV